MASFAEEHAQGKRGAVPTARTGLSSRSILAAKEPLPLEASSPPNIPSNTFQDTPPACCLI